VAQTPHMVPTIGVAHDTPTTYAALRAARAVTTKVAVDAAAIARAAPACAISPPISARALRERHRERMREAGKGERVKMRGGGKEREKSREA